MQQYTPGVEQRRREDEQNAMQRYAGYQVYVDRLAKYVVLLSQIVPFEAAFAQVMGGEMDLVKHLVTQCMSEMRNAKTAIPFSDHVELYVGWLLIDAKRRAEELAAQGGVPRTEAEEEAV